MPTGPICVSLSITPIPLEQRIMYSASHPAPRFDPDRQPAKLCSPAFHRWFRQQPDLGLFGSVGCPVAEHRGAE